MDLIGQCLSLIKGLGDNLTSKNIATLACNSIRENKSIPNLKMDLLFLSAILGLNKSSVVKDVYLKKDGRRIFGLTSKSGIVDLN